MKIRIRNLFPFSLSPLPNNLGALVACDQQECSRVILGMFGASANGALNTAFAILFGEVMRVFSQPSNKVLSAVHLWGALFIVIGMASGLSVFLKVSSK